MNIDDAISGCCRCLVSDGDDEDKTISVMLDNEESFLSFVDGLPHQVCKREARCTNGVAALHPTNLQDTVGYCRILWDTAGYCGILQLTAGYCGILQDTAAYCRILWDTAGYCSLLQDTVGYCSLLRDTARFCPKYFCVFHFFFPRVRKYPTIPNTWGYQVAAITQKKSLENTQPQKRHSEIPGTTNKHRQESGHRKPPFPPPSPSLPHPLQTFCADCRWKRFHLSWHPNGTEGVGKYPTTPTSGGQTNIAQLC